MIDHSRYDHVQPYVTRDGSVIRELMHPDVHGNGRRAQSGDRRHEARLTKVVEAYQLLKVSAALA